jgi:hypothetical protein
MPVCYLHVTFLCKEVTHHHRPAPTGDLDAVEALTPQDSIICCTEASGTVGRPLVGQPKAITFHGVLAEGP